MIDESAAVKKQTEKNRFSESKYCPIWTTSLNGKKLAMYYRMNAFVVLFRVNIVSKQWRELSIIIKYDLKMSLIHGKLFILLLNYLYIKFSKIGSKSFRRIKIVTFHGTSLFFSSPGESVGWHMRLNCLRLCYVRTHHKWNCTLALNSHVMRHTTPAAAERRRDAKNANRDSLIGFNENIIDSVLSLPLRAAFLREMMQDERSAGDRPVFMFINARALT